MPVDPPGTPPSQLSADADFGSINLINGYTGTVSLASDGTGNLTTVALTLTSGTLAQQVVNPDQSVTSTNLTVYGNFNWTGGVLGNAPTGSTTAANVNFYGLGNISPTNAGTVITNSTLMFTGAPNAPEATTINPGTVVFGAFGGGMLVGAFATVTAQTYTKGDVLGFTSMQGMGTSIQTQANGTLGIIGPGQISFSVPITNLGTFNVSGLATVNLKGGDAMSSDLSSAGARSQLVLENGSILNVSHKLSISNGTVFLTMKQTLAANLQTVTINGTVNVSGGTILFSAPIGIGTNPLVYGTFTVNGDVNWTGGTYMPSVDYTTPGLANQWLVNGTMTSAAADVVQPNPQRGNQPPGNSNWQILTAQATAGNLPTVAAGSPLTLGQFVDQAGKKLWKLASA
jgi:hypothetical protein